MLGSLNLGQKLMMIVALLVVNVIVFGCVAYSTISTVQVNGPIYGRIVQVKDIVADVLPPPKYLLELYLIAHQLAEPTNRPELAKLIERCKQLRTDYDDRHKYWGNQLKDEKMKTLLLDKSHRPALRLFEDLDAQFLPAVTSGNYENARKVLQGKIKVDYEEHRAAIDELVVIANKRGVEEEAEAARILQQRTTLLFGSQLVMLIPSCLIAWLFIRSLTVRLKYITQAACKLAIGDFDGALVLLGGE